jgi:hypothetical protein
VHEQWITQLGRRTKVLVANSYQVQASAIVGSFSGIIAFVVLGLLYLKPKLLHIHFRISSFAAYLINTSSALTTLLYQQNLIKQFFTRLNAGSTDTSSENRSLPQGYLQWEV